MRRFDRKLRRRPSRELRLDRMRRRLLKRLRGHFEKAWDAMVYDALLGRPQGMVFVGVDLAAPGSDSTVFVEHHQGIYRVLDHRNVS